MAAITLTPRDVRIDTPALRSLQRQFAARHCTVLENLLDDALLQLVRSRLDQPAWADFTHEGIGTEVVLRDDEALAILHFAVNAPQVLDAVRELTGCRDITWFGGRIYRLDPAAGHYDSWHNDMKHERLVGMSLNLSFDGFDGGEFEIRRAGEDPPIARIGNLRAGDASLFRISPELQHRVAPLRGSQSRTAFAGWFQGGAPDLLQRLREPAS